MYFPEFQIEQSASRNRFQSLIGIICIFRVIISRRNGADIVSIPNRDYMYFPAAIIAGPKAA